MRLYQKVQSITPPSFSVCVFAISSVSDLFPFLSGPSQGFQDQEKKEVSVEDYHDQTRGVGGRDKGAFLLFSSSQSLPFSWGSYWLSPQGIQRMEAGVEVTPLFPEDGEFSQIGRQQIFSCQRPLCQCKTLKQTKNYLVKGAKIHKCGDQCFSLTQPCYALAGRSWGGHLSFLCQNQPSTHSRGRMWRM